MAAEKKKWLKPKKKAEDAKSPDDAGNLAPPSKAAKLYRPKKVMRTGTNR